MKSNAKIRLKETEKSRSIEFEIPNEESQEITAGLIKNNHLRGLYSDYCILNQEFLKYVVSAKLTVTQLNMFILLLSEMDKENKILLNNATLMSKLRASEKTIIESIKALVKKRIIIKQKLGVGKYEIQINYDILNPLLAFKNKASKQNVLDHKKLIQQETPYIRQYNTSGGIDLVNPDTGEIFLTE